MQVNTTYKDNLSLRNPIDKVYRGICRLYRHAPSILLTIAISGCNLDALIDPPSGELSQTKKQAISNTATQIDASAKENELHKEQHQADIYTKYADTLGTNFRDDIRNIRLKQNKDLHETQRLLANGTQLINAASNSLDEEKEQLSLASIEQESRLVRTEDN